jgi:hypothetical protein
VNDFEIRKPGVGLTLPDFCLLIKDDILQKLAA